MRMMVPKSLLICWLAGGFSFPPPWVGAEAAESPAKRARQRAISTKRYAQAVHKDESPAASAESGVSRKQSPRIVGKNLLLFVKRKESFCRCTVHLDWISWFPIRFVPSYATNRPGRWDQTPKPKTWILWVGREAISNIAASYYIFVRTATGAPTMIKMMYRIPRVLTAKVTNVLSAQVVSESILFGPPGIGEKF